MLEFLLLKYKILNPPKIIKVPPDFCFQRLDRFLRNLFGRISQSHLERSCRKGLIRVDSKKAKPNTRLIEGQEVQISLPFEIYQPTLKQSKSINSKDTKLISRLNQSILYEDEFILAINKPPGIATQGGTNQTQYIDKYLDQIQTNSLDDKLRLVHRLDKDTSGVLVLAKSLTMARKLTHLFQSRSLKKRYFAIALGSPKAKQGIIKLPITQDTFSRSRKMIILNEGKNKKTNYASTLYEVLFEFGVDLAGVSLEPETGRTHQLRVHLASIGNPILGDKKYSNRKDTVKNLEAIIGTARDLKMCLHARSLTLKHPAISKDIQIVADFPSHIKEISKALEWDIQEFE